MSQIVILHHLSDEFTPFLEKLPGVSKVITSNPTDTPWDDFRRADVLLTTPTVGWKNAPSEAPSGWPGQLRMIQTVSVGMDSYPGWIFSCPSVCNGRGTTSAAIAEFALCAMLEAERGLGAALAGISAQSGHDFPSGGLQGRTLAIVGYGAIGQAVARRALGFEMNVVAMRRTPGRAEQDGVTFVSNIKELIHQADHLVLTVPATYETRRMINAELLEHAPSHLHIVNVARGELIDSEALAAFLGRSPRARATLDVTDPEPLPRGHTLLNIRQVRITPHIAWKGPHFVRNNVAVFAANLAALIKGEKPPTLVDPSLGY
jgi:phosphoglycerate dehydrogenase-like enzyme